MLCKTAQATELHTANRFRGIVWFHKISIPPPQKGSSVNNMRASELSQACEPEILDPKIKANHKVHKPTIS